MRERRLGRSEERRGRRRCEGVVPDTAEAAAQVAAERDCDEEQVCAVQDGGPDDPVVAAACAAAGADEECEAARAVPAVHVHGGERRVVVH